MASGLDSYREKWREAPRGSDTDGRIFSSELLSLPDDCVSLGMAGDGGAPLCG